MAAAIRVLYVDDDPGLLEVGKQFLEQPGNCMVTTVESAQAALRLLKDETFDAVISDYQMPGMNGIQFLIEVRARFGLVPFILFTGRGREEVVIQAINNGANFYLQKGGDATSQFAELRHKILTAVEHRLADTQVTALNRLYTVLSATNRAIIRIPDKYDLLKEICRICVDDGGFTMVWAGIENPTTHLIEPVAMQGSSEGYLDRIRISPDGGKGKTGPTSMAFREGRSMVCNDISTDECMKPLWVPALKRGYRSLAAFPFGLDTRNAGVITFYASEPGFFTDPIIRLLDEQSQDLSFAFSTFDHEEQRIAAENDLKKSELQYRRLFETAQDAILILDGESGQIIEANPFILDMLGYPLEYFVGKHLWELGFIRDKSIAQRAFTELKTEGYIRYEDIPLERSDGQIFNVEFISNVYLVGTKRIIQCNIRDITDRKHAEEALLEIDARMNSIIQGSPLPQFAIDKNHRIISWNRAIEEFTGITGAEVKGKRVPWIVFYDTERPVLADLLVDEKVEELAEWYQGRISKSRLVNGAYEATDFFPKMGTSGKWLFFTAAPIQNARGGIIGAVETLEDITERKKYCPEFPVRTPR